MSESTFGYVGGWNDDNKDDATFNVLIDTGASVNISGHASGFVGGLSGLVSLQPGSTINGLNGPTAAKGIGELLWQVVDDDGTIRSLCSPGYYVPGATMRLFSPQTLFRQHKAGRLTLDSHGLILKLPGGGSITVHHFLSNLPLTQGKIILKREDYVRGNAFPAQTAPTDPDYQHVVGSANQNLTNPQKELLRLHFHNGHMRLEALQQHIRDGQVTSKHPKASSCPLPKCASCVLAKMTTQHDGTTQSHKLKETEGGLKKYDLFQGLVSLLTIMCVASLDDYLTLRERNHRTSNTVAVPCSAIICLEKLAFNTESCSMDPTPFGPSDLLNANAHKTV